MLFSYVHKALRRNDGMTRSNAPEFEINQTNRPITQIKRHDLVLKNSTDVTFKQAGSRVEFAVGKLNIYAVLEMAYAGKNNQIECEGVIHVFNATLRCSLMFLFVCSFVSISELPTTFNACPVS